MALQALRDYCLAVHRTSHPPAVRRPSRPASAPIRGNSSAHTRGGLALLLSATGDGQVTVGNAVDHPDPAVEVLLMYTITDLARADRHWQAEPEDTDARCMLVGLCVLPDDAGADNAVVFAEAEPAAAPVHARARQLAAP